MVITVYTAIFAEERKGVNMMSTWLDRINRTYHGLDVDIRNKEVFRAFYFVDDFVDAAFQDQKYNRKGELEEEEKFVFAAI